MRIGLVSVGVTIWGLSALLAAADDAEEVMDRLREIQTIVGDWEGSGRADGVDGWDEKVHCQWKFSAKGRVSIYLNFADRKKEKNGPRLLDEAMFTYDPKRAKYVFRAYRANVEGDSALIEFEGGPKPNAASTLVFDRVNKADGDDPLDRLDVKVINDGDRLVYSFHRRIGKSQTYRQYSLATLDRAGTSLAGAAAKGPKCVVTGGPGAMTVAYNGKTYYVCCTGCRDAFLAEPEKYLAKLDAK